MTARRRVLHTALPGVREAGATRSRSAPASACRCFSGNEGEDEDSQEDALRAVDGDADPGAPVSLRWVGDGEGVDEQRPRDRPREVEVVAGEEEPVREPVLALEDAVHAREQEAAEEQLLTEHGVEDEPDEDERVPAQAPCRNALLASEPRNAPKSRPFGPPSGISDSMRVATISGITTSQILPPVRPVRGLRGDRSQSASRSVDQRKVRCSRQTRVATSTNCQTSPTVRQTFSALKNGMLPVPANWSFKAGATSQARAAIGSAAAAHTAKIARSPYCGIATSETAASV